MTATVEPTKVTEPFARLSDASRALAREYLDNARSVLRQSVFNPDFLAGIPLERKPGAYTRNLVYGDEQMSIWAIVWSPGSTTSIHDHHCSCCFGIVSGSLTERRFSAVSRTHAVATQKVLRGPGFIACFLPSGPNIHQMSNDSSDEAISLHIYGFDHRLHGSSVDREYQLALS
ncbi:cysteine dioxygenase [Microvirga sp. Mcv34]|uniref:cysteine dioxygenase n=1 Tax=Microvirga sp. Mcv34 TaxID=2926016 RepID=UPI0021C957BD|nr:cysteine dioxygenase family protein [Microvirga sp. Mcv34]